jgi:hypothetical protein
MLTALKTHGTEVRPYPAGPTVRAVALDKIREEFDKRSPLDGPDRKKALAARRQAFSRARKAAEDRGLIEGREIEDTFMLWIVDPKQGAPDPRSTPA